MLSKKCKKCLLEKEEQDFSKYKRKYICDNCTKENARERSSRFRNKNKVEKSNTIICKVCNEGKTLDNFNKRKTCISCFNLQRRERYVIKEKHNDYDELFFIRKDTKISDIKKENYESIEEYYKMYNNEYYKKRINNDELYRLTRNIRSLVRSALLKKKYNKKSKTIEILGCSFEDFKLYLEKQFESWMSWDNYGKYDGNFNTG